VETTAISGQKTTIFKANERDDSSDFSQFTGYLPSLPDEACALDLLHRCALHELAHRCILVIGIDTVADSGLYEPDKRSR
jgi:hypothetical protein